MKIRTWENQPMQVQITKRYYLIYCRKSSEAEDRQSASLEDQEDVLTELSTKLKLPVLKVYRESMSAKAPGRPVFNEMMAYAQKRGDIKGLIFWQLNRASRNPIDTSILQWSLQQGVINEIVTPSKTYTDFDSDLVMGVEGAMANRFIRELRANTLRGLESKLDKGIAPILAPVGYRNCIEKPQGQRDIEPHPVYFRLLRKVFDLALTGDYSIFELCRKANEMGIRNNRGGEPISRTQIYQVMTNPFYAGRFVYRGILHQGSHLPMLTEAEFDLLQDFVASRSRPHVKTNEFIFNGFVRCGYCNYMITNEFKEKKYKSGEIGRFDYYRCTQKRLRRCPQPYVRAEKLEPQISKFLSEIRLSPKFVDWAIRELYRTNGEEKKLREAKYQAIKATYEGIQKKIQNLFSLKISPENTNQEMITDIEYKEERQKLLIERESISNKLKSFENYQEDFDELVVRTFDFTVRAVEKWENGTMEDKRMILSTIGSSMILKDYDLTIEPRTPFLMIKTALEKVPVGPKSYAQPTHEPLNLFVVGG